MDSFFALAAGGRRVARKPPRYAGRDSRPPFRMEALSPGLLGRTGNTLRGFFGTLCADFGSFVLFRSSIAIERPKSKVPGMPIFKGFFGRSAEI